MATKYEEICDAAKAARINKDQYRERCWGYLGKLFGGFMKYSSIPQERVRFLRWNGVDGEGGAFQVPEEPDSQYSMAGATVLDSDGFWRIGIRVDLGLSTIFFPLLMAEQDGAAVTKVAGKNSKIDVSSDQECNEFYDQLISRIKDAFADPQKAKAKSFGFVADSGPAQTV